MERRELPEGWEWKKLGDVGEYINGKAFKPSDWTKVGKPIIRIQNLTDHTAVFNYYKGEIEERFCVNKRDILISWSASLGVFVWDREPGILNQHIFKVILNEKIIDRRYFVYVVKTIIDKMIKLSHGSTMKHIVKSDFSKTCIPLPPLPVQRRIVEILEQADALRHLRTEADAETQKLLQSVFYEMFGDPVRNEKGWELVKLKEICEEVTVGIVVKPASYYVKDGVPAFRSLNIKEDALNLDNLVHISPDDNNTVLSKSKLKTGDILVVRTGNPGTSCVVPVDFNGANCIDLIIIRPNRDRINSQYLSKFLNSEYGKAQSLASNTGLAQQHLNVRNIREMIIPLPPLHLQQQFSYIKENIERNRDVQAKSKQEIERLFEGLMTVAFTGELN